MVVFASYHAAGTITKNLRRLTQVTQKIASGNFSTLVKIKSKDELQAKIEYLERREQELKSQLENQSLELDEKSKLIEKATNKIEELLGSIDIDG